jgi:hypothetical protein
MTEKSKTDMDAVERALSAAREDLKVPEGLMARVLADAQAMTPKPPRAVVRSVRAPVWRMSFLGGWRGLGGLVAATCAGFWIGIAPPSAWPDAGALLLGVETSTTPYSDDSEALSVYGWDIEES